MSIKTSAPSGLRGQTAGDTRLCTVGKTGTGLTYCGYDIHELADKCSFEEVALLLFNGELPTQKELSKFKNELVSLRELPEKLKSCLELIPKTAHPMDVMRTGCSMLGNIEPEKEFGQQQMIVNRLLAVFPAILLYWYRYSHEGIKIDTSTDESCIAGHFLRLLHGKEIKKEHINCLNTSLVLYAEHEFNASTFTARVCASTLSDMYSCITGAIGTLRGNLHGGANEAAMAMIEKFTSVDDAKNGVLRMLANKEKIMGFGHAIYTTSDPRSDIIKKWSLSLSNNCDDKNLYPISEVIEKTLWDEKKLFPNADFYHASAYHFMSIPTSLFTPIFVCSRLTGWASHVMEQRSNNRIIRPSANYVGLELRNWQPISERG